MLRITFIMYAQSQIILQSLGTRKAKGIKMDSKICQGFLYPRVGILVLIKKNQYSDLGTTERMIPPGTYNRQRFVI
jgi:hypothetical protein